MQYVRLGVLFALLLLAAAAASAASPDGSATLTPSHPTAIFPLPGPPDTAVRSPLSVVVSRNANPANASLSLAFAVSGCGADASHLVRIFSVGIYPPNRVGRYAVDLAPAWQKLQSTQPGTLSLCLQVTLQTFHAKQDVSAVAITIQPPKWQPPFPGGKK